VKRKILIIVENASVPMDPRVWNEASSLKQRGYEVSVLCPKSKHDRTPYEHFEGVHIYRHPMPKDRNGAFGYVIEYGAALFYEFFFAMWIYLRRGFQVIQGCNPPDDIFLVALPFKLLGVKYIFDHHDVAPELYIAKYNRKDMLYKILTKLELLTYRYSDVVIVTNDSYKDLAVSRGGMNANNVFVVRNGPDPTRFKCRQPKAELKYGKRFLVGYVGSMDIQEGLDILIDVALHIRRLGRDDIHFTCVGGGPSLPVLREMLRQKNMEDSVNFTGRIPEDELLDVLSTAEICVNPDRPCEMNNISTMIKIMEYMSMGKPIVQFDFKEGRFSARESSLYADPNNMIEDFAEKILWLCDHPEERRKMGEVGRLRVENELAWKYSIDNLLAAYQRALSRER
jgi:glycosyltransferase involved in cell wall biosynthesis